MSHHSSDPNGDPLTFRWTLSDVPAGSALTDADITGATSSSASFTPDVRGTYEVRLVVRDGRADSAPALGDSLVAGILRVPDDYATIEDALSALSPYDVVSLEAGEYTVSASIDSGGVPHLTNALDIVVGAH